MGATICAREPSAWLADAGKREATGSLSSTTARRWMGKGRTKTAIWQLETVLMAIEMMSSGAVGILTLFLSAR